MIGSIEITARMGPWTFPVLGAEAWALATQPSAAAHHHGPRPPGRVALGPSRLRTAPRRLPAELPALARPEHTERHSRPVPPRPSKTRVLSHPSRSYGGFPPPTEHLALGRSLPPWPGPAGSREPHRTEHRTEQRGGTKMRRWETVARKPRLRKEVTSQPPGLSGTQCRSSAWSVAEGTAEGNDVTPLGPWKRVLCRPKRYSCCLGDRPLRLPPGSRSLEFSRGARSLPPRAARAKAHLPFCQSWDV